MKKGLLAFVLMAQSKIAQRKRVELCPFNVDGSINYKHPDVYIVYSCLLHYVMHSYLGCGHIVYDGKVPTIFCDLNHRRLDSPHFCQQIKPTKPKQESQDKILASKRKLILLGGRPSKLSKEIQTRYFPGPVDAVHHFDVP